MLLTMGAIVLGGARGIRLEGETVMRTHRGPAGVIHSDSAIPAAINAPERSPTGI